jgi:Peptidase A4 family
LERRRRNWKTNTFFLIVLWLILLIASVTILSSVVTPFLKTLQTETLVSFDWSGYGVSSNVLLPSPLVTNVSGSWTVPSVAVSKTDTFSAVWIGVGGQGDPTLIQVGSQHDSVGGQLSYSLWYEILPADSITIPMIDISPGDRISATITMVDSNTNQWLIKISDDTKGLPFSQVLTYNSSRLTAEWIVERPTVNNQLSNLANFGSVTFTGIQATVEGKTGTLTAFPNFEVLMQDRQNRNLVSVSSFSKDGSSFTVNYG